MKNKALSFILFSIICCMTACSADENRHPQQPYDTTHVVMQKVLSGNPGGKVVYRLDAALKKGDKIHAMAHIYTVESFDAAQIFFIDDEPEANWEHPCRYILIDPQTDDYKIIKASAPPNNLDLYTKIYPE